MWDSLRRFGTDTFETVWDRHLLDSLVQFANFSDGLGRILFECLGTDWVNLSTFLVQEYYFPMNSDIIFIDDGYHCSNFRISLP